MSGRIKRFVRTRTLALLFVLLVLLYLIFAVSPLGEKYGFAVDNYLGLFSLIFWTVVTLSALQEWWTAQVSGPQIVGGPKSRIARMMDWLRHWDTDWDWKRKDNT